MGFYIKNTNEDEFYQSLHLKYYGWYDLPISLGIILMSVWNIVISTQASGNWKKREIVWNNDTRGGRSVFTEFRVFPISTSVDIDVHQYGKLFYVFYNIAQRNIKK